MDAPDKPFSELVGLLKSWIPKRSEPANVSRDFWMPDQSCRVCYECDSQFTVFNRRHHCRHCGRVFCAKCTPNSIPAPSSEPRTPREDWEKIRVCNYCYKQWVQGITTFENGIEGPILDLSTSSSVASLASTKSSSTVNSSSITLTSIPYSVDPYQQTSYGSGISLCQSSMMETNKDEQAAVESSHPAADVGDPSQNQFGFCINRSDDDEDGYAVYQSDSETRHYIQDNYYVHAGFDDNDNDYESHKVHPDGETNDAKSLISSPLHHSFDSLNLEGTQHLVTKNEHDIVDESEASSSFYAREDINAEPVDFENNGLLWLPPEPEDEEDEKEAVLFDDDDEGDAVGEWGYERTFSSFGSGEYRNRDKSSEEHKKAMKNVVDGHFRALVAQLLQVENLPVGEEDDNDSWLEIITSLSWEAATLLKPDMSNGGGMDPGGYVKVKCIASGHRRESMVIKGVVCKKNVAHRRMTAKVEKPRLLILGGALEYQRVSNLLSSFDTLLQQEMDHLKMAVAKIDVHRPDVLLVEKSVSRFAQEYLLAKDISLVLNIKRPLLERIARCTGAQIVPSIDHLSQQKLGYCDIFHVERLLEEHGTAGQGGKKMVKTLMFFEGCPKPLGCTILLRGANGDELKKVKHVVQYGIFAAYHLALETCFLADEGASLPELPLNTPITVALPDKPGIDRSISTIPGFSVPVNVKSGAPQTGVEPQRSNSTPSHPAFPISIAVEAAHTDHSRDAPSSQNESSNLTFVNLTTSSPLIPSSGSAASLDSHKNMSHSPLSNHSRSVIIDDLKINGFGPPEAVGQVMANIAKDCSVNGVVTSSLDATDGSTIQQSSTNHEEDPVSSKEEFLPSPSDHQSILVSLSSRCVWKGTVCERSHLFRIKYYGNFDKPLGRYLRDQLFDQNYRCRSCEKPSEAHVHCYNHRQGTLTIAVKKFPNLLPGEKEGKIWMWHRCLRCPQINGFPPATRRIVMSDAAWGLSFGKFLELSFSNHAAASRVASCGHSLHRDCLRFYGFGKMVACFRYASIDVHSVYLPPSKLDFNYENQEWIQKEASEVVQRAELLFSEVLNSIRQIVEKKIILGASKNGMKVSDTRHQFAILEGMLQWEKTEFEGTLQRFLGRDLKNGRPVIDILDINRLQRQLVVHSYVWNCRLVFTADANDKSIHDALVTSIPEHEKHMDTNECPADTSMLCFPDKGFSSCDAFVDTKLDEESIQGERGIHSNQWDINQGTVKGRYSKESEEQSNLPVSVSSPDQVDSLEPGLTIRRAHSEGQFPVMSDLSDTLDAAWTGENQPVVGIPKDTSCAFLDISTADLLATAPASVRLNLENHVDDQSGSTVSHSLSSLCTKDTDNLDDCKSWLRMPFQSFYRKNFLGSAQKLDAFGDFNSFYVSSFRNLGLEGGARLLLPVGVNETVIPVYDDEPASIISYALVSPEYHIQLSPELERPKDSGDSVVPLPIPDPVSAPTLLSLDESASESYKSFGSAEESILSMSGSRSSVVPLSYAKAVHARVSFTDDSQHGKVKYTVICYYANQFEALRRICCPHELDFVRSLSRCKKWGAQGGKSNVFFAKTLDDRFILKQVTKTELESFIKFAPGYFKYLSESINSRSPTCLAKILGIYQVTSKHFKGGKESKMDILVMENLLFGRNITRLYDLKGSSRSRYNPDSSGSNKVLLDENLIEAMPTSPIFVGNKAKRLLERAVWNDTSFLATIDVMDYSLLVGMDKEKHELVLGIIDFMRQYTWDKHLETWVKASGILGGSKNASPTVISPMQYKKRFRKAMSTYFLMVPDQWPPSTIIPSISQSDLREENAQDRTTAD